MKIRQGFVSNSSSSSFICLVSGGVEGGYDCSLRDVEMSQCENGHTFYNQYLLPKPEHKIKENYNEEDDGEESILDDDFDDEEDDDVYDIPEERCPICTLTHITDEDLLKFILKSRGFNRKGLEDTVRSKYTNYKAFLEAMKA